MPSAHISLYYHFVFITKNRKPWILESYQERLWAYLGGIVRGAAGVPHAVGGVEDHVHLLAQLSATCRVCDLLRDLKSESSMWMYRVMSHPSFAWQEGYGAFSVSAPAVEAVKGYIQNQRVHHANRGFKAEYLDMLGMGRVEFKTECLW
jgi:putative transposase